MKFASYRVSPENQPLTVIGLKLPLPDPLLSPEISPHSPSSLITPEPPPPPSAVLSNLSRSRLPQTFALHMKGRF